MKKIILLFATFFIVGCGNQTIDLEENYIIKPIETETCKNNYQVKEYYSEDDQKIYLVCLSDIMLNDKNNSISLKKYLDQGNTTISKVVEEFTSKTNYETGLFDGGTLIYKSSADSQYVDGDLTLIKCNTLDGNNDIYIGPKNIDTDYGFANGLCGHE